MWISAKVSEGELNFRFLFLLKTLWISFLILWTSAQTEKAYP